MIAISRAVKECSEVSVEVARNIFFLVVHLSGTRGFLQTLSALKRAFTFEPGALEKRTIVSI